MLKVANAQAELPEGASPSIVKDDFGNVYGMFFALTGDGLSDRELSDYSELIKREVSELDGVERVDLYGNRPECINISLLQDRMANLGVKPAEVLATLNGQNKTTYTGYYDNGDSRIRVTVSDKFKTVEDIGRMLIQGHDADQLRLSDIARIEKDYEERTWLVHIDTDSGYTWLWFCCIWIPDGIYGRTIHGANTDGWRIVSGQ